MPDTNKLKVFEQTRMTIFKSCILCRYGEIPNSAWGYCKHPDHFYTHGKHGRVPGVSHASMGCNDFEFMNEHSREMVELGPYLRLLPLQDDVVEVVGGVEDEDTTEADFEEAGRLTDSVVAES